MGLREIKKQKVRASIIENAIALFRQDGFEATTVREICVRCEVSEASFFNYFPTKGSVLSAWAHRVVGDRFADLTLGSNERAGSEAGTERGLRRILRSLCADLARIIEDDCEFCEKAWARASIPTRAPEVAEQLVRAGQDSGELRRDLSARQMGGILYVSLCGTIADWLEREAPRGPLVSELRRAADLVLDGSRRRNERVRPVARPAATRPAGEPSTR